MKITFLFIASALLIGLENKLIALSVTSIYDGDTFKVNLKEVPAIFGENLSIRIAKIDTPELRGKCDQEKILARKAKQFTAGRLRKSKSIILKNPERGKYFRVIAEVYVDGQNLGEELLKEGLAVKYDGGKRKNWCE
ncbi:thermonuclease family protein [Pseudoalteromonas sp. BZB3]|uniref:thermonuclease family protein n=1 Tax=Pseudoalteromonas sp. BZB3 TaxID=3136670 RepID=UPI0032C3F478